MIQTKLFLDITKHLDDPFDEAIPIQPEFMYELLMIGLTASHSVGTLSHHEH